MRIQIGNIPEIVHFQPEAEGLHVIREPKPNTGYLLAGITGFLLLIFPILGLCLILSYFAIPAAETTPIAMPTEPWGAILLALFSYIPLHELFHLIWHPQWGTTNQSLLILWPAKLRFGVYFEGCMSRTRWVSMRIAPFVVLSLIPAALLAIFRNVPANHALKTFFEVLLVVNGAGSGADVAAIVLVMAQVPPAAWLVFRGGRAYWQQRTVTGQGTAPEAAR